MRKDLGPLGTLFDTEPRETLGAPDMPSAPQLSHAKAYAFRLPSAKPPPFDAANKGRSRRASSADYGCAFLQPNDNVTSKQPPTGSRHSGTPPPMRRMVYSVPNDNFVATYKSSREASKGSPDRSQHNARAREATSSTRDLGHQHSDASLSASVEEPRHVLYETTGSGTHAEPTSAKNTVEGHRSTSSTGDSTQQVQWSLAVQRVPANANIWSSAGLLLPPPGIGRRSASAGSQDRPQEQRPSVARPFDDEDKENLQAAESAEWNKLSREISAATALPVRRRLEPGEWNAPPVPSPLTFGDGLPDTTRLPRPSYCTPRDYRGMEWPSYVTVAFKSRCR
ncbi:uncharacterized protein B0H18DRAFT_1117853 [Fomitopsis serialis]|uniref:uncharacterized protein n=1 Tax=Fomitopsis serialis TaxID=139415 RepID=UPI0020079B25|nr:uncharacterized protein B0H18DRAFT_1117853 [Neoantrodia serialis]KAH9928663.1 hypothetical protein B0H18DRAFT_1117853 [Neoantrodia serialis]